MNDYDPEKTSTFITSLDMNNLYGWGMSEYLPDEEFQWLENIDEFNVMSIDEKSDTRYFFKLILNILMNCINYIMIIDWLQENVLFLVTCFQNMVKKLLINIKKSW